MKLKDMGAVMHFQVLHVRYKELFGCTWNDMFGVPAAEVCAEMSPTSSIHTGTKRSQSLDQNHEFEASVTRNGRVLRRSD